MLNGADSWRETGRWVFLFSVALCVVFAGLIESAPSQTGRSRFAPRDGDLAPRFSTVPLKEHRPAEGTDPNEMWNTRRAEEDNAPVASFIDTLQTPDVDMEVVLGQARLLTTKSDIAGPAGTGVIAVGDPSVLEFEVLPNPRVIRLVGKRAGVTDLSIITADGQTYAFRVHVVYDLELLRVRLKQAFPDAYIRLTQMQEHLVVEGEARSPRQASQIVQVLEAYLASVSGTSGSGGGAGGAPPAGAGPGPGRTPADRRRPEPSPSDAPQDTQDQSAERGYGQEAEPELRGGGGAGGGGTTPQVFHHFRVPGVHQVMLQVRVAELNRTGLREVGADILGVDPGNGNIIGTQIGGAAIEAGAILGLGGLTKGKATGDISDSTTAFGIFPSGDFEVLLRALRRNQLLSILAEPNLMAMSGEEASFLAGGQFPVPVPQSGAGGAGTITIEWKDFGVLLDFVPYVLDDEWIRLEVAPEVSTIDDSLGIVVEGLLVPRVITRKASTTVELREGQTLALAGLLEVTIEGNTSRIPGLGDLPYIGPMFSNTGHKRVEKELLVLVTPYLVSPMEPDQVAPLPGEDLKDPTDLEFYLLNRIQGRTCHEYRSTLGWSNPLGLVELLKLERSHVCGPAGFSE